MKDTKIKVGITQGDINGIGYEVIIKTLVDARILEICTPIIYGSPKVLAYHKKVLDIEEFNSNNIKSAQDALPKRVNIINCTDEDVKVELGKSTTSSGEASLASLEAAVADLKEGHIDVLLTAPINKKNIQSKNFVFPGHTEYLEAKIDSGKSLMLLVSEKLRIGVVTGHIPLAKVSENITEEKIIDKLNILNKSLIQDFGIRKPKLAVLSLNPHVGDEGLIGSEENEVIIPAIEKARKSGIMALGPYPADGFFGSNDFSKFDAILAMYHDQGLTAFKALSFESGVNFTAGLSKIRTSPVHGTAYAIAGTNTASPESFQKALYMAIDVYNNRAQFEELSKDPMKVKVLSSDYQNKRQIIK